MTKPIDRGYAYDMEFELQAADGSVLPTTGVSGSWRLAASAGSAQALITKPISSAISEGGKTLARVSLSTSETEGLTLDQYYHQLSISVSGGEPRIYFAGFVRVAARL